MSDPIGTVIGKRYEIAEVIGRGGQGVVCRAHDRVDHRDVAIKMLTDAASRDTQFVERLRREQQAMAVLKGTSAVELVDLCTAPSGALCLVMELLVGRDFEATLADLEAKNEHFDGARLLSILEPLADTLDRAHASGIVHRDIKPANIFLVSENAGGGVRLLDFGFARLRTAQPLTQEGTVLGSPSYIAPEVWRGLPNTIDHRVDIYALGVIVFRALTGALPFEGATLYEKFIAATTAERPRITAVRSDLPPAMDAWVRQALAIDSAARFPDVKSLRTSLAAALGKAQSKERAEPPKASWGFGAVFRAAGEVVKRLASRDTPASSPAAAPRPQTPVPVAEPDPEPVAPVRAILPMDTVDEVRSPLRDELGSGPRAEPRPSPAQKEDWPFAPPPKLSEWQARQERGADASPGVKKRPADANPSAPRTSDAGADRDSDPSDTAKTLVWIGPRRNDGKKRT